jgi:hypothetical protein
MKPDINSVKVHPQLSHNGHPVDGLLVGCWFTLTLSPSPKKPNSKQQKVGNQIT